MVSEKYHDGRFFLGIHVVYQFSEGFIGIAQPLCVIFQDLHTLIGKLRVRFQIYVVLRIFLPLVGEVVLHGYAEKEQRIRPFMLQLIYDPVGELIVGHEGSLILRISEILHSYECVESEERIGLVPVEESFFIGMEREGFVPVFLEFPDHRRERVFDVLIVGHAPEGQELHHIPGERFELHPLGFSSVRGGDEVSARTPLFEFPEICKRILPEGDSRYFRDVPECLREDEYDIRFYHLTTGSILLLRVLQYSSYLLIGIIVRFFDVDIPKIYEKCGDEPVVFVVEFLPPCHILYIVSDGGF